MDVLKLIPQIFYDIIARVIPGCTTILVLGEAVNRPLVAGVFSLLAGRQFAKDDSMLALMSIWVVGGYVAGLLLAPLGKVLRDLSARVRSPGKPPLIQLREGTDRYLPKVRDFLLGEVSDASDIQVRNAVWSWYDWLRIYYPDAGSICAKMRAEYSMFASLGAGLIVALCARVYVTAWQALEAEVGALVFITRSSLFLGAVLVGAVISLRRSLEIMHLFERAVIHLYVAARGVIGVVDHEAEKTLGKLTPESTNPGSSRSAGTGGHNSSTDATSR